MATYPSGNTVSTENNLANIREKMVGAENFGDSIFTTLGLGRLRRFSVASTECCFSSLCWPWVLLALLTKTEAEPIGAGIVLCWLVSDGSFCGGFCWGSFLTPTVSKQCVATQNITGLPTHSAEESKKKKG